MNRRHGIAILVLLAVVAAYQGWHAHVDARHDPMTGDQMNLAVMVLKIRHPELLTRDYAFGDPAFFSFYTPSFLHMVAALDGVTGATPRSFAVLVGAAPMALTFFGRTPPSGALGAPFQEFWLVLHQRIPAYWFPYPATQETRATLIRWAWVLVVGVLVALTALVLRRLGKVSDRVDRWVFLILAAAVLPLTYQMVKGDGLAVFAAVVPLHAATCAIRRTPERADWLGLSLLVLVVLYVYGLTPIAQDVVGKHQLAGWTALAIEQPRISRYIFLALFLMTARSLFLVGELLERRIPARLAAAAIIVALMWPVRGLMKDEPIDKRNPARSEMQAWVRANTPVDALFYWNDLSFRIGAQRAITHCSKDMGLAYYSRTRLVEFFHRFQRFEAAYRNAGTLASQARGAGANYIVVPLGGVRPGLPVVFQNRGYVIYQVTP